MVTLLRPALRRLVAPLALGLLLCTIGCYYNGHRNMGATEKWVASDVNVIPKTIGTIFISILDSLVGPATMAWDQMAYEPQYHPDHTYFSYAASRTIARSQMSLGYQWVAMFPAFIFDTVYLIITGPVDLIWVLGWGHDEPQPEHGIVKPVAYSTR